MKMVENTIIITAEITFIDRHSEPLDDIASCKEIAEAIKNELHADDAVVIKTQVFERSEEENDDQTRNS